jgi:hypothetical protein
MTTLVLALQLIIIGFFFRLIEITWPDSKLSKALAFIH